MSRIMKDSGFTIKELVMVIVVIGILCFAAIPTFYTLQNSRRQSDMEKLVNKVQAEITTPFPNFLDEEPINQSCLNCFNLILEKGIQNPLWFKISDTEYLYSRNGNFDDVDDFKESGDFKVVYNNKNGTLIAVQIQ